MTSEELKRLGKEEIEKMKSANDLDERLSFGVLGRKMESNALERQNEVRRQTIDYCYKLLLKFEEKVNAGADFALYPIFRTSPDR